MQLRSRCAISRLAAPALLCSFLCSFSSAEPAPVQAQDVGAGGRELTTVQESRPYVARTGAWQTWSDHLHIKPGMEKRHLVLTLLNGAEGRAKVTDLRVALARKPFITLKDFGDKAELSRVVTGTIGSGDILVTTEVFGPSGARLVWKLSTDKVTVNGIQPNPFSPADKITIEGTNFGETASGVKVKIGQHQATVSSANNNRIEIKPPHHMSGGVQDLVVDVFGAKSQAFKVSVKGSPQITWVDLIAAPPSHPVVITGKGFSKVPAENSVMFGTFPAHIVSSSETSITSEIPMMDFPRWHVPITVTTNGMVSKEKKVINVDHRIIENRGVHQY